MSGQSLCASTKRHLPETLHVHARMPRLRRTRRLLTPLTHARASTSGETHPAHPGEILPHLLANGIRALPLFLHGVSLARIIGTDQYLPSYLPLCPFFRTLLRSDCPLHASPNKVGSPENKLNNLIRCILSFYTSAVVRVGIMAVHRISGLLPFLLLLLHHQVEPTTAQLDTVSLTVDYPHSCVKRCLWYPNVVGVDVDDIGSIMKCAAPYANDCYCATPAPSATRAASWISKCASSKCAEGDLSRDLSAMGSVYASYCMEAGFTQPGATNWFDPLAVTTSASPRSTSPPGAPATTAQLPTVIQTSRSGAANPTLTGEPTPNTNSGSNLGLGLGLGLGIPAALIALGIGIWLCVRSRRKTENAAPKPTYHDITPMGQYPPPTQYPLGIEDMQVAAAATKPVTPKFVPPVSATSQTPSPAPGGQELSGQPIRRELGGTELHPFPTRAPSSPVAVPGQYELYGHEAIPTHYPGQVDSATPGVYQQPHNRFPHYQEMEGQQR